MKIKMEDDEKIVLYLYNYFFNNKEKDIIIREIKNLFLKLIKNYHMKINGIYEVLVFENKKYGTILEIEKKAELLFNPDVIDIKVKIFNADLYLKTNNYFVLDNYKNIYYFNNNYYININDIDNIINVLEFVDIIYKEKDNYLNKMLLIK